MSHSTINIIKHDKLDKIEKHASSEVYPTLLHRLIDHLLVVVRKHRRLEWILRTYAARSRIAEIKDDSDDDMFNFLGDISRL